jgi:HSP20 family protein
MLKDSGLWSEVEKLRGGFDDILRTAGLGTASRFPAFRLHSRPEEYRLLIELPGVAKEAVSIVYRDRQLTVSGRKSGPAEEEGRVERDETFAGPFERAIPIPTEVDGEKISARFQDGILAVRLPRLEKERPRNVNID